MDTPKLSITRNGDDSPGPKVLHLIGPLVMSTTADFQQQLRAEPAQTVVLDFTEVPFIDSAGLGAAISIFLHFKKSGRKLAVSGMNEKCRALLKMTNVEQLFPMFDSVESARSALA
jgi:anti-sigma B factor antagonist